VWRKKYAGLRVHLLSGLAAAEEFNTPGFSQLRDEAKAHSRSNGFDNTPKPLKRLNRVSGRNTGLKSGVTEIYMTMAGELKCDMFATA
jgi:hypothetical protein